MKCPACGFESIAQRGLIDFCRSCGHRWLDRSTEQHAAAEAIFNDHYVGYRPDPAYVAAVERVLLEEVTRRVPPPARLLDVGCGAGDLLVAARAFGYEVRGIDISPASARICRSRDLDCIAGDFLSTSFDGSFDVIVFWDVAAHLRDPASYFERARELLTDRGMLFVKTPALGEISVRLANALPRLAGTLLSAPSHNQYFGRGSLSALFCRTGFTPEYIKAGNARSTIAGGSLKRRLARGFRRGIGWISGDTSLYIAACRSPRASL